MASLEAGSAARTAHEIADHDYHHATLPDAPVRTPYMQRRPKDRPAG